MKCAKGMLMPTAAQSSQVEPSGFHGDWMPQLTISLDDKVLKELERLKEATGLPLSKLIQLRLRGFQVVPVKSKHG